MKIKHSKRSLITTALLVVLYSTQAWSAVTLDRTRIIFNSDQKNVALTITNKNTQLPYLAQGWIENDQEQKVSSPFAVLPRFSV